MDKFTVYTYTSKNPYERELVGIHTHFVDARRQAQLLERDEGVYAEVCLTEGVRAA